MAANPVLGSKIAAVNVVQKSRGLQSRRFMISGRYIYLTYRDDQMAMLKNLVATFLELAIVEGLSLSEKPDRRV